MALSPEDERIVEDEMRELRISAGLTFPIDVYRLYDHLGIPRPKPLYSSSFETFRREHPPSDGSVIDWDLALLGFVDKETGDVYVDETLPQARWRSVAVHEAMHIYLQHLLAWDTLGEESWSWLGYEDDAKTATIALLCPKEEFISLIRNTRPLVGSLTAAVVNKAADHFGITFYTALRRLVETTNDRIGMVTFRFPKGHSRSHVSMSGFSSWAWNHTGRSPIPRFQVFGISDPIGRRAELLLNSLKLSRQHDEALLEELIERVSLSFQCDAEPYVTAHSVHMLLTSPSRS